MVTPSPATTEFTCSQCGGELHPDEGQMFLTCPFCGATVYVDKSRVVFHWYIAPTLNDQNAVGELYRWMSGSQTVKDLDKKARVLGQSFQYFPVWYFKWQQDGKEQIALQPAAATSVTELARLNIPAGDLRKYDPSLDAQAAPPTVPLESALEWLHQRQPAPALLAEPKRKGQTQFAPVAPFTAVANAAAAPASNGGQTIEEMAIVHIPLYFYKYEYNRTTYTAVVDAASGGVMANLFPPKREAPYLLVGIITALVYLCLALVPLASWGTSSNGSSGATGLLICGGLGLLAAPFLFAWAFWVASKV